MPNNDNLIGHGFHERSAEEAREMGAKGGINSGKTRRRKKLLRECLEILMEKEVSKDKDGNPVTAVEAMAVKAMKSAMEGDWKAWELVRDTAGQKPVDKVMVSDVSPDVIAEVESIINDIEQE